MDMIHEYIRERVKGRNGKQKVGLMVGLVHNGVICTAFSKANLKAGDEFDIDEGFRIATARALGEMESPEIPTQLIRPMRELQMRCVKYFQQADLLSTKGAYPTFQKNVQSMGSCSRKSDKQINLEHYFNRNDISKNSLRDYIFAGL